LKSGLHVHLDNAIEDAMQYGPHSRPYNINEQSELAAMYSNSPIWGERAGLLRPWILKHTFLNGQTPEFRLTIPLNEIWLIHRMGIDKSSAAIAAWQLHFRQASHPATWDENPGSWQFAHVSSMNAPATLAMPLLVGTANTGTTIESLDSKPGLLLSQGDQIRARMTAALGGDQPTLCIGLGESWLVPQGRVSAADELWTTHP